MKEISLLWLLLLCAPHIEGQSPAAAYREAVGPHLLLYRGVEYTGAYPNTAGHPFFGSGEFVQGAVTYRGVLYEGVPLRYELVRQELHLLGPGNRAIVLLPDGVDSFSIGTYRFVHLRRAAGEAGYFEAAAGSTLIRHEKLHQRGLRGEDPMIFTERKRQYRE